MSFWSGMWRLLGAADDDSDEQTIYEHPAATKDAPASMAEVLNMPVSQEMLVHVLRPDRDKDGKATFSIKRYSEHLKEQQAVILDVSLLAVKERSEAIRIVDVLTGVTEGIDGNVWEVAENVFMFAPRHMKLKGIPVRRIEVS